MGNGAFGECREVRGVTRSESLIFAACEQLFARVFEHRLEQHVAIVDPPRFINDERLAHETGEEIDDGGRIDALAHADVGRRIEREWTGEDGEPAEELLFVGLE